jgi:glycosyltransferase involved in cell wall biosynthesis
MESTRMARVMILFSSSFLGGAERSLSRMALASNSIDYTLATMSGEGPWTEWVKKEGSQPQVFGSNFPGIFSFILGVIKLTNYLKSSQIDILYVCGFRIAFILRALRFLYPKVRLVHAVRWNPNTSNALDRTFRLIERTFPLRTDLYITNSEAARLTLVNCCGVRDEEVVTIYNGVENIQKNLLLRRPRPNEILTIANLAPRKGYVEFLHIIREVIDKIPDVKFVFIGRDDMNGEVQNQIKSLGLDGYITYEGFKNDVSPWLRRATIFVLPSLWGEGCPTSILEAMSYGVPVVANKIDGIPELVKHNVDGVLCGVGSTDMTSALITMLRSPTKTHRMGMAGHDKVASSFSLQACVNRHADIFNKLIKQ